MTGINTTPPVDKKHDGIYQHSPTFVKRIPETLTIPQFWGELTAENSALVSQDGGLCWVLRGSPGMRQESGAPPVTQPVQTLKIDTRPGEIGAALLRLLDAALPASRGPRLAECFLPFLGSFGGVTRRDVGSHTVPPGSGLAVTWEKEGIDSMTRKHLPT